MKRNLLRFLYWLDADPARIVTFYVVTLLGSMLLVSWIRSAIN